ncbi:predicted protein [Sclerotinia sclerotiorum 1980 UF-70]|uniref:Uncharacterized protein n=2 Tax=Sclerotinia sclerotiorum (strain ATCC 18683 / 1980 / Ss-1) TaxID=665079 RepID=A7E8H9_SCLS1|nr:predicted protein [Sclerotinia sclerotiorum 1980 UF-70]APA05980.1 hypothetical protein sscle_01g007500 [Sclerotinia sclerotiorum 1980 UF-70]EDN96681.1 predicted protein [Sclerotinia sclerotiorum 1980 UF-70]
MAQVMMPKVRMVLLLVLRAEKSSVKQQLPPLPSCQKTVDVLSRLPIMEPALDKAYNLLTHYRIPGPELVNKSVPSCGLPSGWSDKHDRCIAYLSTHAPLVQGKVPKQEALQPRHSTREITTFILKRFPELCRHRIKETTIELRLELLDRSENSYFSVAYGGYSDHEWARGI